MRDPKLEVQAINSAISTARYTFYVVCCTFPLVIHVAAGFRQVPQVDWSADDRL